MFLLTAPSTSAAPVWLQLKDLHWLVLGPAEVVDIASVRLDTDMFRADSSACSNEAVRVTTGTFQTGCS